MNCCTFFEYDFIGLFVLSSHSIEESVLISFKQIEKHPIFLDNTFHIIFEHDFSKISSDDFCKSLTTENLTNDVFFSSNGHPSHNIVVERILAKALAFIYLSFLEIALE